MSNRKHITPIRAIPVSQKNIIELINCAVTVTLFELELDKQSVKKVALGLNSNFHITILNNFGEHFGFNLELI